MDPSNARKRIWRRLRKSNKTKRKYRRIERRIISCSKLIAYDCTKDRLAIEDERMIRNGAICDIEMIRNQWKLESKSEEWETNNDIFNEE